MTVQQGTGAAVGPDEVNAGRLFAGSCFALIATAVTFAVVGAIMGTLKQQFILTNEQVGIIGGAGLWGFPITIFIFGPLCDTLGMRFLLRLAFLCHLVGVLVMMAAQGFMALFLGQLIIAMGNGLVEAACNPLVATIYPDRKTEKLNQFHVWFPGGIVLGGLGAFLLDKVGITSWQVKLALILLPTLIYGYIFLGQKFPSTERVKAGITFGGMMAGAFTRPLFWILLLCMGVTASLELGPNRWVPAVLEAGGIAGILVLVWINGLMALMRYFAGPVVERLAPTGILLVSAVLAGVGLLALSFAESIAVAFLAATVFALGVCYFWPTMLGVTSERVPKGGALALAFMGGWGNVVVGLLTIPLMGHVADKIGHAQLPVAETRAVLQDMVTVYPAPPAGGVADKDLTDSQRAHRDAAAVLEKATAESLPVLETANALRRAMESAPDTPEGRAVADRAKALIGPADNYGGRISFRYVAWFSLVIIVVFGTLYARDRMRGGYQVERLEAT